MLFRSFLTGANQNPIIGSAKDARRYRKKLTEFVKSTDPHETMYNPIYEIIVISLKSRISRSSSSLENEKLNIYQVPSAAYVGERRMGQMRCLPVCFGKERVGIYNPIVDYNSSQVCKTSSSSRTCAYKGPFRGSFLLERKSSRKMVLAFTLVAHQQNLMPSC